MTFFYNSLHPNDISDSSSTYDYHRCLIKRFRRGGCMSKIITYLIIVTMYVITADAFAQRTEKTINKALKHYEENLTNDNEGVVKSSIQNIMRLKVAYPEIDYSDVRKKLEDLSFESESKIVRYMAYVAVDIIKYPEQFQYDSSISYDELDEFFHNYQFMFDKPVAQIE